MFSGIVSTLGTIRSAEQQGDLRIVIDCDYSDLALGESVACNGACLTVVETDGKSFSADLSAETITCTAPRWTVNETINLERSLKLSDGLSGHLVTGHIDGLATIDSITPDGDSHIVKLNAPAPLSRYIAAKGSVTLDGVSLTVNKVDGHAFVVNIIPHTWQHTTLGKRKPGDAVNLEIDLIARYVERLMQQ